MWALRQLVFRVTFLAKALSARVTHFDTRRSLRIRYETSVHRHMFHHLFSDGRLSPPRRSGSLASALLRCDMSASKRCGSRVDVDILTGSARIVGTLPRTI